MAAQLFNKMGVNGRTCPVCYRDGSLIGRMDAGATLQCEACANCFKVDGATLERLPVAHPVGRVLSQDELARVHGGDRSYRPPLSADEPCRLCGRKHCQGHAAERL